MPTQDAANKVVQTIRQYAQKIRGALHKLSPFFSRAGKAFHALANKGIALLKTSKHPARYGAIIAAVVLYLVVGAYFSFHYLPGTSINGRDVSLMTPGRTTRAIEEDLGSGATTVSGNGIDLTIDDADIDLTFDAKVYKQSAANELPGFGWLFRLFSDRSYHVSTGTSFDADELETLVTDEVEELNEDLKEPVDATVSYNKKAGSFEVIKEEEGTALDTDQVVELVTHGVEANQRSIVLDDSVIMQPSVRADNQKMAATVNAANEIAATELTLSINDERFCAIESELVRSWITIDKDFNAVCDLDAIAYWTRGELSSQIDTVGTSRTYNRPDGKKIEVVGGTYGWNVDGATLANTICDRLEARSSGDIPIPFIQKGAKLVKGGPDWGWRYVDVDITEQVARFYDGSKGMVWSSPCVTGDVLTQSETVTGVYAVEEKESPSTLIGEDEDGDGEPDYENDVEYWIQFFFTYGLHDAPWRSSFTSDLYQYAGSHGCVNLPTDAAAELYDLVKIGDPVVVHE